jgi:nucleoside-diphosphate-sugar epimerase
MSEREGFIDEPYKAHSLDDWAKRLSEVQTRLNARELRLDVSMVRPLPVYGPRDHFDSENADPVALLT